MIQAGNIVSATWSTNHTPDLFRIERTPGKNRAYWDMTNEAGECHAIPVTSPTLVGLRQEPDVCSFCFKKIEHIHRPLESDSGDLGFVLPSVGIEWSGQDSQGGVAHQSCFDDRRKGTKREAL